MNAARKLFTKVARTGCFFTAFTSINAFTEGGENLNWERLSGKYEVPSWYQDAKLGIWTHWGPQAFPEQGGGWYARHMYMQDVGSEVFGKNAYAFHLGHFGHPSKAGYKDVLNAWKTPALDTDKVVKYAKHMGARYFVAMANHHDHFDCWDSTWHPWNSVRVGPHRDFIGEFSASAKKFGLRFGASSHDDRYLTWWLPAFGTDKAGPQKGIPYDGNLTKEDGKGQWWEGLNTADLYGLPPAKRTPAWEKSIKETWRKRHLELITKYHLDYLWFDGHNFPYGEYGRSIGEGFYNNSLKKDGEINVVLAGKPVGMSAVDKQGWVMDYERGVPDKAPGRTFQSITTVRTWFYKRDSGKLNLRQNARSLVELFADVISKGGNMLLNLELRGDGSFPPDLMPVYDDFGAWVNLNAEAIYGTRAWVTEGDNRPSDVVKHQNMDETDLTQAKAHSEQFNERTAESPMYRHDEVRFTVKGDRLYIFVLNPAAGPIALPSLGLDSRFKVGKITGLRLIGGGKVKFTQSETNLTFEVPAKRPGKFTAVFEVTGAVKPK